jgi:hypothetical protein
MRGAAPTAVEYLAYLPTAESIEVGGLCDHLVQQLEVFSEHILSPLRKPLTNSSGHTNSRLSNDQLKHPSSCRVGCQAPFPDQPTIFYVRPPLPTTQQE